MLGACVCDRSDLIVKSKIEYLIFGSKNLSITKISGPVKSEKNT